MKFKLALDFGNSEVRCVVVGSGIESFSFVLPNTSYVASDFDRETMRDYNNSNSSVIELHDFLGVTGAYATGLIKEEYYLDVTPNGKSRKIDQPSTGIALGFVFKKVIEILSEELGMSFDDVALQTQFDLIVLVPVLQVDASQEFFNQKVANRSFRFADLLEEATDGSSIKKSYTVSVGSISVMGEGASAFLGLRFDHARKQIREDYKPLGDSKVLVLDIGAGTTDMLVINKSVTVKNTVSTFAVGVNDMTSRVYEDVKLAVNSNDLPMDAVKQAMYEGVLKVGRNTYEISSELNKARQSVSADIVKQISNKLNSVNMPLSTIEDILLIGGGVSDTHIGLNSLNQIMLRTLKHFAVGAEEVDITSLESLPLTPKDFNDNTLTRRYLNVAGAYAMAVIQLMTEEAEEAAKPEVVEVEEASSDEVIEIKQTGVPLSI